MARWFWRSRGSIGEKSPSRRTARVDDTWMCSTFWGSSWLVRGGKWWQLWRQCGLTYQSGSLSNSRVCSRWRSARRTRTAWIHAEIGLGLGWTWCSAQTSCASCTGPDRRQAWPGSFRFTTRICHSHNPYSANASAFSQQCVIIAHRTGKHRYRLLPWLLLVKLPGAID